MKQYGATAKVGPHGQGLGGGLMGQANHLGIVTNGNIEDGAMMNMEGQEEQEESPLVDEDDFFNQDDRDMTDYNYQKQKEMQAAS